MADGSFPEAVDSFPKNVDFIWILLRHCCIASFDIPHFEISVAMHKAGKKRENFFILYIIYIYIIYNINIISRVNCKSMKIPNDAMQQCNNALSFEETAICHLYQLYKNTKWHYGIIFAI